MNELKSKNENSTKSNFPPRLIISFAFTMLISA
ncbi:hypothetical protein BANRA_05077 [Klebsiella pneumoniae]|nr:hypothetical protein BANRA_05077 [Klebsiella pneumoniae]